MVWRTCIKDSDTCGAEVTLVQRWFHWVSGRWSNTRVSSVQLSCVRLFATPWITARQASLSITNSRSSLRLRSIESVMPSSHLILCRLLLLLSSIFPRIRVFSNESALPIRWPNYWSFSFNISPPNEHSELISSRMDWLVLLASPRDSQESSPRPTWDLYDLGTPSV